MSHRAAVWRGDLLQLLNAWGGEGRAEAAALTGFEWQAAEVKPPVRQPDPPPPPPPPPLLQTPPTQAPEPLRAPLFAIRLLPPEHPQAEQPSPLPELVQQASSTEEDAALLDRILHIDPALPPPPQPQALSSPVRIGALLRQHLRQRRATAELDVPRWLAQVARGRLPQRLPRRQRLAWGHHAGVFVQGGEALQALNGDAQALIARALREAGHGVQVAWWEQGNGWYLRRQGRTKSGQEAWQPLESSAHLPRVERALVVNINPAEAPPAWRPLQRLAQQPGAVLALAPAAPTSRGAATSPAPEPAWPTPVRWVAWEHGQPLRARASQGASGQVDDAAALKTLLACLSLAVPVEPALLRAVRLHLGLPTRLELLAWNDPAVQSSRLGLQLRPKHLEALRQHLCAQVPLATRRAVAAIVEAQHRAHSPLVQLEEAALASTLAGLPLNPRAGLTWERLAQHLRQAANAGTAQAVARYVGRTALRVPADIWRREPALAQTWVLARQEELREQVVALPPGLPADWVGQLLGQGGETSSGVSTDWHLAVSDGVWLLPAPPSAEPPKYAYQAIELGPSTSGVTVERGTAPPQWHPVREGQWLHLGPLPEAGEPVVVRVGAQAWQVEPLQRPPWALEMFQNQSGCWVSVQLPWGAVQTLPWPADGRARLAHSLPIGADIDVGADDIGLFLDLSLSGPKHLRQPATQRLRYLPPGQFHMGSTAEEQEAVSAGEENWRNAMRDESPRHSVTLTEGYWLADTPCTQALWQAVVGGKNPSHFSGKPQQPVEQESWDDVMQHFMPALQALLPEGCEATLPSEAQWEYACRAGTETAYHWGNEPNTTQANMADAAEQTTPVRYYPANPWGLFDMHGNVFEWCLDGMRTYEDAAAVDPMGAVGDGPRALRGGSWGYHAGDARSASRNMNVRRWRNRFIGFRLALRFKPGPGAGGPEAEPTAADLTRTLPERLLKKPAKAKPKNTKPKRK